MDLTTGDLILIINLLHADARHWLSMPNQEADAAVKALAQRYATDRRALAQKLRDEITRREREQFGSIPR